MVGLSRLDATGVQKASLFPDKMGLRKLGAAQAVLPGLLSSPRNLGAFSILCTHTHIIPYPQGKGSCLANVYDHDFL